MKTHKQFVHLHNHSHYSLLDGSATIDGLINRAVELQFPAIALTDHGNMSGAIEFYKKAHAAGIKPIIGLEAYVAPESRFKKEKTKKQNEKQINAYHLILLAKDEEGYKNLIKLSTLSYKEGFYYKPRIDKELLRKYHKGLIATSACLQGEVAYNIVNNNFMGARKAAYEFKEIFGDDFYLEVQYHKIEDEKKAAKGILKISKELNIPVIVSNDTHYLLKEDSEAHDILLCLQTGKIVTDKNRMRYEPEQFYLKSYEEMYELFGEIPGAFKNTIEIMDKCNLELNFTQEKFPKFNLPSGVTAEEYLRTLAMAGLKKRFPDGDEEALKQLETELDVINNKGYAGYFLIVQDFIKFAKSQNIEVGPGRGSAAGSILSYVLEITDINPLKYGLFFERFLNPERKSEPDIDVDFEDTRRDEVIEYVRNKYGDNKVSQIITFNTYKAKGIVRAVGRAMGINLKLVDKLAKQIDIAISNYKDSSIDIPLSLVFQNNPEAERMVNKDEQLKKLWEISLKLEGVNSNAGKHAAGVVISDKDLSEYVPLMLSTKENAYITQYDMDALHELHMLKMDFLGLKTLSVIKNCLYQIEKTENIKIDWDTIPMDDKETYKLLQKGNTKGVFQMESAGMQNLLKKMKPTQFSDIVVSNALYRPGPLKSGMADEYVRRKNGEVEVDYIHPVLKPVLEETYGVIAYQEQVMKITQVFGGFSLGEADLMRRAMSSKSQEVMEEQREKFVKGAVANNYDEKLANRLFDLLKEFAGYGFNKSHSVSYAMLTYRTAYLKAHYPEEFMASILTNEMKDLKKIFANIVECKKIGIDVLAPDINTSFSYFVAVKENNKKVIKFGLAAIKNVGAKLIDAIVEEREKNGHFKDFIDFIVRLDSHLLNKRTIESLIKAGAFDKISPSRKQLLDNYDILLKEANKIKEQKESGQMGLFASNDSNNSMGVNNIINSILKNNEEWDKATLLRNEKEVLGFYIYDHPLHGLEDKINRLTNINLTNIDFYEDKYPVKLVGIISEYKEITTRDNKKMAFIKIENLDGLIEGSIGPELLPKVKNKLFFAANTELLLNDQEPFLFRGELVNKNREPSIRIKSIFFLSEIKDNITVENVYINLPGKFIKNKEVLYKINDTVLKHSSGGAKTNVFINTSASGYKIKFTLPENTRINATEEFVKDIENILGDNTVIFA